jgi:hypothetical protein
MGCVFVVQEQFVYDRETGQNIPRFPTITKAEEFGEIKFILDPPAHPFNQQSILGKFHEALSSFSDDDHLILVGNPILLGMATAIAAYYNQGRVKFLQWSPKGERYVLIPSEMF